MRVIVGAVAARLGRRGRRDHRGGRRVGAGEAVVGVVKCVGQGVGRGGRERAPAVAAGGRCGIARRIARISGTTPRQEISHVDRGRGIGAGRGIVFRQARVAVLVVDRGAVVIGLNRCDGTGERVAGFRRGARIGSGCGRAVRVAVAAVGTVIVGVSTAIFVELKIPVRKLCSGRGRGLGDRGVALVGQRAVRVGVGSVRGVIVGLRGGHRAVEDVAGLGGGAGVAALVVEMSLSPLSLLFSLSVAVSTSLIVAVKEPVYRLLTSVVVSASVPRGRARIGQRTIGIGVAAPWRCCCRSRSWSSTP